MVDNGGVADLTGAAGVSQYDGVRTCGTFPPPTFNNPTSTTDFTATGANKSTNPVHGEEVSTDDPPGVTDSEDMESDDEDMVSVIKVFLFPL